MKILLNSLKNGLRDLYHELTYYIKSNLKVLGFILLISNPYVTLIYGYSLIVRRNWEIRFGGELLIPIIMFIASYLLSTLANTYNKGSSVPVPARRFTEVIDDNDIVINQDDIQEIILYLNEVENYLERKGKL